MSDNIMKLCIQCNQMKKEDKKHFPVNRKRPDGSIIFRTRCLECYNIHRKQYKPRDLSKQQEKRRVYYQERRDVIKKRTNDRYYRLKKEEAIKLLTDFYKEELMKTEEEYK